MPRETQRRRRTRREAEDQCECRGGRIRSSEEARQYGRSEGIRSSSQSHRPTGNGRSRCLRQSRVRSQNISFGKLGNRLKRAMGSGCGRGLHRGDMESNVVLGDILSASRPSRGNAQGERREAPLGIPSIAVRMPQIAKMFMKPTMEQIFHPDSCGYCPAVQRLTQWGQRESDLEIDWVTTLISSRSSTRFPGT